MHDLLPCPFCGGPAEICITDIMCRNRGCGAMPTVRGRSLDLAAQAWNTRDVRSREAARRAGMAPGGGAAGPGGGAPPSRVVP